MQSDSKLKRGGERERERDRGGVPTMHSNPVVHVLAWGQFDHLLEIDARVK